jgi:hypothetical protein
MSKISVALQSTEKVIGGVTVTWQVAQRSHNDVTNDRWSYNA